MGFKKSAIWGVLEYYIVEVLMKKYVHIDPKAIEAGGGIVESEVKFYKTELGFAVDANTDFWACVIQGLLDAKDPSYALVAKMLEETLTGEEKNGD